MVTLKEKREILEDGATKSIVFVFSPFTVYVLVEYPLNTYQLMKYFVSDESTNWVALIEVNVKCGLQACLEALSAATLEKVSPIVKELIGVV